MRKYYKKSVVRGMTYEQAERLMDRGLIVSRPEWEGFHYKKNDNYYILLENGEIIKNPEEVFNKESRDWCLVMPSKDALKIIRSLKY